MKDKGKKSRGEVDSNQEGKKDMSKIKCFNFHEFRNYATKHQHKRSSKKTSRGVEGTTLASHFELDFTLIACMASTMMGSVWYLDSGDSFHIMGNREILSDVEEKDLQMHIEM